MEYTVTVLEPVERPPVEQFTHPRFEVYRDHEQAAAAVTYFEGEPVTNEVAVITTHHYPTSWDRPITEATHGITHADLRRARAKVDTLDEFEGYLQGLRVGHEISDSTTCPLCGGTLSEYEGWWLSCDTCDHFQDI